MQAALVVQKYGGTSLATPALLQRVARRVSEAAETGTRLAVVVSAPGDTTDRLLARARGAARNPDGRELAKLLATGEGTSAPLLAIALRFRGVRAVSFSGAEAGVVTDASPLDARIVRVEPTELRASLGRHEVPVIAGFQGRDADGNLTTLGRGGSDLTAVAVAAALDADVCEICSDVDGVYTADPDRVASARRLPAISYDELAELTSLGAGVVHDRAVLYASRFSVPLHVRSSFHRRLGTLVSEDAQMEKAFVRALALDPAVARVAVRGVPARSGAVGRVLRALAAAGVHADLVQTQPPTKGRGDVLFVVRKSELSRALAAARGAGRSIGATGADAEARLAKLSVVGIGMRAHADVAATLVETLARARIPVAMLSTSEIRISAVIPRAAGPRALRAVHKAFRLEGR